MGLSAGNNRTITGGALANETWDLADPVEKETLISAGELRYARYRLAVEMVIEQSVGKE